jgi:predicted GNAT superfamily acetyltransferase
VERRIRALGRGIVRDASVAAAPLVNPSEATDEWLLPGAPALDLDARRILVEIPTGFSTMQRMNPQFALQWRLATRRIFQTYFRRGYRAVDFHVAREASRGHYILAKNDEIPNP